MNDWLISNAHLMNEDRRYAMPALMLSKCAGLPFAGETLSSSSAACFINGQFARHPGEFHEGTRRRGLEFEC